MKLVGHLRYLVSRPKVQIEVKVPIMIERGRSMIKVLLVDDHEMVRMGVSAYLSTQPDIEVVGKLRMEEKDQN